MYEELVKPLISCAWDGGSATLFAYGQTGSGKTFTVSGMQELVAEKLAGNMSEGDREIFISFVELAGNTARGMPSIYLVSLADLTDLLNERAEMKILEDSHGTTHLMGAIESRISSAAEILTLIETANSFRRTKATRRNDTSSRSHAICRIRVEIPSLPDGHLYLVDLAGSEAARDVATHGAERMRETREINTSLSVLKDCIRAKAEARTYVPLRRSALTKVLKHVLDPEGTRPCKTVVVACINPSLLDAPASRNTLRYAELLRFRGPS